MKLLEKKELMEIRGGNINPITKLFYWAIGYMGTEVAWGAQTTGTALPYVAFK